MTTPLKPARLRTTRRTAFCWELTTCAVRTSSAVRPNLVCAPVAVTSATASPRRDQRAGIGLHAGAGFDGHGFAGEHGLVEQDFSGGEFHIRGDHRAEGKLHHVARHQLGRGYVFHAPSRRTDAFSASRDFSAARVAWARLS